MHIFKRENEASSTPASAISSSRSAGLLSPSTAVRAIKCGELLTKMAKQHDIKYDNRPAHIALDKATEVI